MGPFRFAPLVAKKNALVAELRITFPRPEPPGAIITQAGDLDNRLKTLLDALKVPTEGNALPKDAGPAEDEDPFYCLVEDDLVEDDLLVTGLAIATDRLLEPGVNPAEVNALIHVRTKHIEVYWGTIGI